MSQRRGLILFVLILLIGLASYQHWNKIERYTAGGSSPPLDTSHQVVMYSTAWCPACRMARTYFARHAIDYVEYDIEKSYEAKRQYKKLRGRGVPLILIGTEKITGWSPRAVEDALARLQDSSPAPPAHDADQEQEMVIMSREDTQEERKQGKYIILLRNGRKITVKDYWERGDKIEYRRLGGIIGIERKQVVMIESQAGGTKTWYSPTKN